MHSKWSTFWTLWFANLVVTLAPTAFAASSNCSRNYSAHTAGTIRSPGYPGPYKNEEFCNFAIKAPSGSKVNLTFLQASLELFRTQLVDYILLFDGADCMARRLAAVVNTSTRTYVSSGSSLTALFISDITIPEGPFVANFSAVSTRNVTTTPKQPFPGNKILEQCGKELNGSSGRLSYTATKGTNQLCIWRIRVRDGKRVKLNVTKITMTSFGSWLRVLDGNDCSANVLYYLRGNSSTVPPPVTSTKSSMLVVFSASIQGDLLEAFYNITNMTSTGTVTSSTLTANVTSTRMVTPSTLTASRPSFDLWKKLVSCLRIIALRTGISVPE